MTPKVNLTFDFDLRKKKFQKKFKKKLKKKKLN